MAIASSLLVHTPPVFDGIIVVVEPGHNVAAPAVNSKQLLISIEKVISSYMGLPSGTHSTSGSAKSLIKLVLIDVREVAPIPLNVPFTFTTGTQVCPAAIKASQSFTVRL